MVGVIDPSDPLQSSAHPVRPLEPVLEVTGRKSSQLGERWTRISRLTIHISGQTGHGCGTKPGFALGLARWNRTLEAPRIGIKRQIPEDPRFRNCRLTVLKRASSFVLWATGPSCASAGLFSTARLLIPPCLKLLLLLLPCAFAIVLRGTLLIVFSRIYKSIPITLPSTRPCEAKEKSYSLTSRAQSYILPLPARKETGPITSDRTFRFCASCELSYCTKRC